ncbi:oxidoreductase [Xaviernesmea oryzae]|uniref:Oxidoreductase n=1 Tax=Xaviernesmea oryzae TaxID=464029 RepID=A0A1Q9AVD7_9HYPH|nr:Gfo/Idh/MocA family oxidoreductase [Xaviernesmea oryzae]OLP59426.1 oxidoreductase [Xaviernesmea oryzae]SEL60439.1 Predicted dehydrogenase [Xaviernesmea oryzae]
MTRPSTTGIAFVGCGFVADYYGLTLANHPSLRLVGVHDILPERSAAFCQAWKTRAYDSLEALLADPEVEIVVNLTPPHVHAEINLRALSAGKHVYCEKPLAMAIEDAEAVVRLAEEKGLVIAGAPANALSSARAHCARLLGSGVIGKPRLAYAEMEDGPVFRGNWRSWKSAQSGAPWPGVHEFTIGCTLEHSGYAASWLVSLFGAVDHVTAFASLAFPDKGPGTEGLSLGHDFSVGCLAFRSGVSARLTSGLGAPRDRSLTIVGDAGIIVVRDLWDEFSAVHVEPFGAKRPFWPRLVDRLEHEIGRKLGFRLTAGRSEAYPKGKRVLPPYPSRIDFARGVAVQAEAIRTGTAPYFSGRTALHLTDIALALHAGLNQHRPLPPAASAMDGDRTQSLS